MATLFDTYERIVPTWLAAAQHLEAQSDHSGRNLLLEIPCPLILTEEDWNILNKVNAGLVARNNGLTIDTVAGTIFPQGLYAKYKYPALFENYHRVIDRAKKPGTWGTYFDRMTRRKDAMGKSINPLDNLIIKIRQSIEREQIYQSTYELPSCDPTADLAEVEFGTELGTYDPSQDARRLYGGPCLSHLSFKITNKTHVDLTAMYRSHSYCSRALGNLIGLGRLLLFVAKETGLETGTLSCLSTHATLDLEAWSAGHGARSGRAVLASLASKHSSPP